MSETTEEKTFHLGDYKAHYRLDAEAIVDPAALHPVRQASERRRLECLRRLLRLRPGERLLDMGCGSGWLAEQCRASGAEVWAADISLAGVATARGRYPQIPHFQVADVYHLAFAGETFDALVLSEVVEHLEDIAGALAEVRRVLRRGGRVLVSVPYREVIAEHLCIHCNRLTPAHAHLHSFDEVKLEGHLRAAGLAVARELRVTNKALELLGFPRWSRWWPYWGWRSVDALCNRIVGRPAFLCMVATKAR